MEVFTTRGSAYSGSIPRLRGGRQTVDEVPYSVRAIKKISEMMETTVGNVMDMLDGFSLAEDEALPASDAAPPERVPDEAFEKPVAAVQDAPEVFDIADDEPETLDETFTDVVGEVKTPEETPEEVSGDDAADVTKDAPEGADEFVTTAVDDSEVLYEGIPDSAEETPAIWPDVVGGHTNTPEKTPDELLDEVVTDTIADIEVLDESVTDTVADLEILDEPVSDTIDDIDVLDEAATDTMDDVEVLDETVTDTAEIKVLDETTTDTVDDVEVLDETVTDTVEDVEILQPEVVEEPLGEVTKEDGEEAGIVLREETAAARWAWETGGADITLTEALQSLSDKELASLTHEIVESTVMGKSVDGAISSLCKTYGREREDVYSAIQRESNRRIAKMSAKPHAKVQGSSETYEMALRMAKKLLTADMCGNRITFKSPFADADGHFLIMQSHRVEEGVPEELAERVYYREIGEGWAISVGY